MNLASVVASLTNHSWLTVPEELIQYKEKLSLSKKESRSLLNAARGAIDEGIHLEAENNLYAGLLLGETRFLEELQKSGILRLSRMSYVAEPLTSVVSSLLSPQLGLSGVVTNYLRSVASLHEVARSVRSEYEELRQWLAEEREHGIRGVLGTLDYLFLKRIFEQCPSDPSGSSRDAWFFSAEHLGEGFSTILAMYYEEFGALRGNVPIDGESAANGDYYEFLVSGTHLAHFREWELLIDRFGYRMVKQSDSTTYSLQPPSFEQHRAMELGYLQDFIERCAKHHEWHDAEAPSFIELGKEIEDKVVTFVDKPFPRYRCEFPEPLLDWIVQVDGFSREEQKTVKWACRAMSVSVEELFGFNLGNGVTIEDLFRVSRIVTFMLGVSANVLREESEKRLVVVFNSLVPALPRETLTRLIGRVVGETKAEAVIELLSVGQSKHIDICYTPLLPAGDCVLLPVHVFALSNIYRNSLITTQQRLFDDGTRDPLSEEVARCFSAAHANVYPHVEYSWNGEVGEIDVLATFDDIVFVCECKNSLLPTGVHELRTSLDHIETAAGQLARFMSCCRDSRFREWLSSRVGKSITEHTRIIPAIIVSNRMFLGSRIERFPVRGNHELAHFLDSGKYRMVDQEVCMWQGESLTSEDIRRFFEEDVTYRPFWGAMEPVVSRFEFGDCVVELTRLRLNMIALADRLGLTLARDDLLQMARSSGIKVDDQGHLMYSTMFTQLMMQQANRLLAGQ